MLIASNFDTRHSRLIAFVWSFQKAFLKRLAANQWRIKGEQHAGAKGPISRGLPRIK